MARPRLALGTAQFGLNYGISNLDGKPSRETVRKIIKYSTQHKIQYYDTAPAYGDSEKLLGELLPDSESLITTKVSEIEESIISPSLINKVESRFFQSLLNLKRECVHGLLLHSAEDLFKPGADKLFTTLQKLKNDNLITKIGVSVYTTDEMSRVLEEFPIDIVQLPLSIYDQRFVKDRYAIENKYNYGVELHSRSSFLQGLILMPPDQMPSSVSSIKHHHKFFQDKTIQAGFTPLEAAVNYVENLEEIDIVVYGVAGLSQLKEIIEIKRCEIPSHIAKLAALDNSNIVDPRTW